MEDIQKDYESSLLIPRNNAFLHNDKILCKTCYKEGNICEVKFNTGSLYECKCCGKLKWFINNGRGEIEVLDF